MSGEIGDSTFRKGLFTIYKNKISIGSKASDKIISKNIAQIIIYEKKNTDTDYNDNDDNVGGYPIIINNVFICQNCD